ncbi:MAG: preprotein translocase subunit Sec61beta [Candidatus Diapherotrites archaeon]|nr:preprotein translocase subunit Sec61beta [Candidatus Diapherotrites archaeon]
MKFRKIGDTSQGPSSTLGIMRFFDVEIGGPKISPGFVIGLTLAFILIIIILKFI